MTQQQPMAAAGDGRIDRGGRTLALLFATPPVALAVAALVAASDSRLGSAFAVVAVAAAICSVGRASRPLAVSVPAVVIAIGISAGAGWKSHYWSYVAVAGAGAAVCMAISAARARVDELRGGIEERDQRLATRAIRHEVEDALASGRKLNYVEREINRAQRYEREVSIAVAEVDNFDLLRARHGDAVALQALASLGKLLSEDTRLPDGGIADDLRLVFVFPETPLLGARIAAERVRLAYQALKLEGADGVPVTTSIGVAAYPTDGKRAAEVIDAATEALDRAAGLGGNRSIISHSPEGAPAGWSGR